MEANFRMFLELRIPDATYKNVVLVHINSISLTLPSLITLKNLIFLF